MAKFNIKKIEQKAVQIEKRKQRKIKKVLRSKRLLDEIPKGAGVHTIEDGILLFGKHRGKHISDLLASYKGAPYVIGYLAANEDLPSDFKNQIRAIITNQEGLASSNPALNSTPLRVSIKERVVLDGSLDEFLGWSPNSIDDEEDLPF